jgi:magnesium transporter
MEGRSRAIARGPSRGVVRHRGQDIDDNLDVVAEFEKDVDEIESRVFARGGQREVERVYQLKRELIEFKRCVHAARCARCCGSPLASCRSFRPRPRRTFVSWLITTPRLGKAVASFDEVLSSILQAGLARASVADNEDMRKISAWVAIVAVPTMVAGIYGMNFDNMPELHWRYGYFALLGVMLLIMVTLYFGFKRNHWL